ncbi:MAG: Rsd/AlgQ family anti-sigma factor [Gammaproteobacteria bacterium]|nr:MAG: Rsd/AlgQ family anti-sigma factor [Gammaproteobacteria bacterium]
MMTTTQERRTGTRETIDKLLCERQQLLVKFCKLAGAQPLDKGEEDDLEAMLQRFCELLVDYSAFAHFEIYDRIINGRERRSRVIEVAREVYPRIAEASEVAVEFNDKYDANDHPLDLQALGADLNKLGEELAIRAEMEDRIIAALLGD